MDFLSNFLFAHYLLYDQFFSDFNCSLFAVFGYRSYQINCHFQGAVIHFLVEGVEARTAFRSFRLQVLLRLLSGALFIFRPFPFSRDGYFLYHGHRQVRVFQGEGGFAIVASGQPRATSDHRRRLTFVFASHPKGVGGFRDLFRYGHVGKLTFRRENGLEFQHLFIIDVYHPSLGSEAVTTSLRGRQITTLQVSARLTFPCFVFNLGNDHDLCSQVRGLVRFVSNLHPCRFTFHGQIRFFFCANHGIMVRRVQRVLRRGIICCHASVNQRRFVTINPSNLNLFHFLSLSLKRQGGYMDAFRTFLVSFRRVFTILSHLSDQHVNEQASSTRFFRATG